MLSRFIGMGLLVFTLVLIGCGKVTQVTETKEDFPAFSVQFSIPLTPTSNIVASEKAYPGRSTANMISVLDQVVVAQISGLSEDGSWEELSWGRGLLLEDVPAEVSDNVAVTPSYLSHSFRKGNIKIVQSNYKWGFVHYDATSHKWVVDAVKVKRGYRAYRGLFFTLNGHFLMMSFFEDKDTVQDESPLMSLGDLSSYDTFLTVLYLEALEQWDAHNLPAKDFFAKVFTPAFFERYSHDLSFVRTQHFNLERPLYVVQHELQSVFLRVVELVFTKELKEAKLTVEGISDQDLSPEAKAFLLQAIGS